VLNKLPSTRLIFGYPQEGIAHTAGWRSPAAPKLVQIRLVCVLPRGTLLQPEPWAAGVVEEAGQHCHSLYPADGHKIVTDGCTVLHNITA